MLTNTCVRCLSRMRNNVARCRRSALHAALIASLAGCSGPATPAVSTATPAVPPAPELVRLETGDARGVRAADAIAWKGLPYAAPPVGELRWRAPEPATAWAG